MRGIDPETKTFVISTLDAPARQRLRGIEKHLSIAGFQNVEIIRARTPESEKFGERGLPEVLQGRWRTDLQHMWGSAACALSHLDLMKLDASRMPFLVFEDDAIIDPCFFSYMAEIDFPPSMDWDVCHLSYFNDRLGSARNPSNVIHPNLVRCVADVTPCTHSYILNASIYDRITPLLEEIDWQLARRTETVQSFVIEHSPPLTSPNFDLPSVRDAFDHASWHENNPAVD